MKKVGKRHNTRSSGGGARSRAGEKPTRLVERGPLVHLARGYFPPPGPHTGSGWGLRVCARQDEDYTEANNFTIYVGDAEWIAAFAWLDWVRTGTEGDVVEYDFPPDLLNVAAVQIAGQSHPLADNEHPNVSVCVLYRRQVKHHMYFDDHEHENEIRQDDSDDCKC
jgi:hypothetical protein